MCGHSASGVCVYSTSGVRGHSVPVRCVLCQRGVFVCALCATEVRTSTVTVE